MPFPNDIKRITCLACGANLNAYMSVNGAGAPSPNDWNICFQCGHIMAFDENGGVRDLNSDEQVEAGKNTLLKDVMVMIAKISKPRQ